MNINQARLVSFITNMVSSAGVEGYLGYKNYSGMTESQISYLAELVQACQPEPEVREVVKEIPFPTVGFNVPNTPNGIANTIAVILQAMKEGKKIEAIKTVRNLTAIGLKEAKDLVEDNWIVNGTAVSQDNITLRDRIVTLENENKSLKDDLTGWSNAGTSERALKERIIELEAEIDCLRH